MSDDSTQTDRAIQPLPASEPVTETPPPAPPPKKKFTPLIVGSALLLLLAATFMFAGLPPGSGNVQKIVTIPPGSSAKKAGTILRNAGLVRSSLYFTLLAKVSGKSSELKAGPYQLTNDLSPSTILDKIVAGDIYIWRFAVPEGYSIFQLAEMLAARNVVSREDFLAACTDPLLLRELELPASSVEGYLYPKTYDLVPGSTAREILTQMTGQFKREIGDRLTAEVEKSGMTRHQVVTLASLVEKEAVKAEEKPLIAAVFRNRLRKGMRLQSDPTAVYGKRAFGGTVTGSDVREKSAYNTYLIPGLPPGPIGNPGIDAITAVLQPANVSYLYFVAKKDGTHHFSDTLDEHNRAVAKYLK